MSGIIDGFLVIAVVILVGYLLARRGVLGPGTQRALSEVVFFVGAPALLFVTLAGADIGRVLSSGLAVTAVSSLSVAAVFAVVARFGWRRDVAGTTVGALASSYVNAGNLGIPITVYVLGDAEFVAPVMLFQLVVIAPAAFAVLDAAQLGRRPSIGRVLSRPVRNPVTVASALGLLFAAAGWDLPDVVWQPIELLGAMAVPMALLAFGISLHGAPLPGRGGRVAMSSWSPPSRTSGSRCWRGCSPGSPSASAAGSCSRSPSAPRFRRRRTSSCTPCATAAASCLLGTRSP